MRFVVLAAFLFYANDIFACESSKEYKICEKRCSSKGSIPDYFDCAQECKDTYCVDGYEIEHNTLSVERNIDQPKAKMSTVGS